MFLNDDGSVTLRKFWSKENAPYKNKENLNIRSEFERIHVDTWPINVTLVGIERVEKLHLSKAVGPML